MSESIIPLSRASSFSGDLKEIVRDPSSLLTFIINSVYLDSSKIKALLNEVFVGTEEPKGSDRKVIWVNPTQRASVSILVGGDYISFTTHPKEAIMILPKDKQIPDGYRQLSTAESDGLASLTNHIYITQA